MRSTGRWKFWNTSISATQADTWVARPHSSRNTLAAVRFDSYINLRNGANFTSSISLRGHNEHHIRHYKGAFRPPFHQNFQLQAQGIRRNTGMGTANP